jgi:hypothetical protein
VALRLEKSKGEVLPQAIKEVYTQIFSPETPIETIYPVLYEKIINEGADAVTKMFRDHVKQLKNVVKECEKKIKVKTAKYDPKLAEQTRLMASDAGYNGVDLRATYVPLYAATAILTRGWEIEDEPICCYGNPAIWPEEWKTGERESLLSFGIQYEVTTQGVRKWKPKLAIIDGSLILHPSLRAAEGMASEDYKLNYDETVLKAVTLLHTTYKMGIPIVGFVKRTRIHNIVEEFSDEFGLRNVRDTAILNFILKLGQYTQIREKPSKIIGAIKDYREKAINLGLEKSEIEEITNFYSIYIKSGHSTPFRLEMPQYALKNLPEITSIIYSTAYDNGIPFSIQTVDQLTKISTKISNLRTLSIYSRAMELIKDEQITPEDFEVFALQFGEPWQLKETGARKTSEEEI